ncbi:hypothetical protein [Bacteroides bouchesdurhonensis]|jgi:hypothetical protein|uniref:hypothetical protein n=1 Tax=Bacteroides bouchesdurhonensis TaxID=1841855 RepID=UPI00097F88A6|nr:hypothetical protein [Bacteroides bouchesdurhonensis]
MKEDIKNRVLQNIANTLSMYVYHIDNNGLVNGKMGIMLFLYCYSRYTKEEYYEDFAGELLDGMLKISRSLPPGFEDGLAGVGWGFDWLMKHDFVEGDSNKVLKPIDNKQLTQLAYGTVTSITAMLNYWTARIQEGIPESDIVKLTADLLEFIHRCLKNGGISLYHINAILHFLWCVRGILQINKEAAIIQLLNPIINEAFNKFAFEAVDLFIFHQLLKKYNGKIILSKDAEITFCLYASVSLTINQRIKAAWQEWIYFDKVTCPMPEDKEIMEYVDKSLQSMQLNDFVLNQGLAGLGLWILNV